MRVLAKTLFAEDNDSPPYRRIAGINHLPSRRPVAEESFHLRKYSQRWTEQETLGAPRGTLHKGEGEPLCAPRPVRTGSQRATPVAASALIRTGPRSPLLSHRDSGGRPSLLTSIAVSFHNR